MCVLYNIDKGDSSYFCCVSRIIRFAVDGRALHTHTGPLAPRGSQSPPRKPSLGMPTLEHAISELTTFIVQNASRISELMDAWDTDKNGLVSKKEFRQACTAMGLLFPREVVDTLFDSFDEDLSGNLSHNELVMKARRLAFQRGHIPKGETKERSSVTRLNAYWERRNRTTMEEHEQKTEAVRQAELQRHREYLEAGRRERMHALAMKRAAARERAVDRNERFWIRKEMQEAHAESVKRAWSSAYTDQVVFLPKMAEAATMAKKTWAREMMPERQDAYDDERRAISELSDVWAGSVVKAWKKPSHEQAAAGMLRKAGRGAKGKAPQARQFKISPRVPQLGAHSRLPALR